MRLIDADALIDEICQDQCERKKEDCGYTCEMAAYVDTAPTIGGWTSMKDGLPEKPGYYLTASDAPAGFPKLIRTLMFVQDLHKVDPCNFRGNHRPGWVDWDDEYGYYEYDAVTHWMPLPDPPEGVNDNAES